MFNGSPKPDSDSILAMFNARRLTYLKVYATGFELHMDNGVTLNPPHIFCPEDSYDIVISVDGSDDSRNDHLGWSFGCRRDFSKPFFAAAESFIGGDAQKSEVMPFHKALLFTKEHRFARVVNISDCADIIHALSREPFQHQVGILLPF